MIRSQIIVTSRRASTFWQDARVKFISLDFLKPVEEIVETMKPHCRETTHAFYASYVHNPDFGKLREYNVPLFTNFLTAIDTVAGVNLQRVCVGTGGKVCYMWPSQP